MPMIQPPKIPLPEDDVKIPGALTVLTAVAGFLVGVLLIFGLAHIALGQTSSIDATQPRPEARLLARPCGITSAPRKRKSKA